MLIISNHKPSIGKIMLNLNDLPLQYLTDEAGKRRAVVLPIEKFQQLLEDLADLAIVAERRDEPSLSHADFLAELRRDGLLSD